MKRYRRLRRLIPDAELLRRRATGATLRELAPDYNVAHTTLARYFGRPEIARQLKEIRRSERQAATARRALEGQFVRNVRREAKLQVAHERERGHPRAMSTAGRAARRPRRSAFEAWLDEHDAREPRTRADLRSHNNELAAETVRTGGGVQDVIETTGLRTHKNALRLIDPVILSGALDNDAAKAVADPVRERLRQLVPDADLVRRRAAGESLRQLAPDYGVRHTTLSRYFQRPELTKQLHEARRRRLAE